jgi:hypothetical protein
MEGDGAMVHLVAAPEWRFVWGALGHHGGRRAGGRDVIPGSWRHNVGLMPGGLIVCCVVCYAGWALRASQQLPRLGDQVRLIKRWRCGVVHRAMRARQVLFGRVAAR